jgi:hypothetical protein
LHVEQHEVERSTANLFQGLPAILRNLDGMAEAFEPAAEHLAIRRIIIHDKNAPGLGAARRFARGTATAGGAAAAERFSAASSLPKCSTICSSNRRAAERIFSRSAANVPALSGRASSCNISAYPMI